MSYDKRPPSIETFKAVVSSGPIRLRFANDTRTMLLDAFTSNALVAVYEALSSENRAKIDNLVKTKAGFMRFVDFCFKHVKAA